MAEQITLEEWLSDNQLGIDIWKKKYQNEDESFEQWLERVSGGDEKVKSLILEKKFLFGGRILANRNVTGLGVTYSNCYVLSVKDSIEDIYKCCAEMARTFSYGGKIYALPPCIVIYCQKVGEPINMGCMFNMLTVKILIDNTVLYN